jgi:adenylosuccinate synthase
MSGVAVIGAQWGDEGKGKVVDLLSEKADLVVRYQGGSNAGHTIVNNGEKYVFRLLPSGILREKCQCLITDGVVFDPEILLAELDALRNRGIVIDEERLKISDGAALILPYHKLIDAGREERMGHGRIGTTMSGVGPAYEDRASRRAILFRDLFSPSLKDRLALALEEKNHLLKNYFEKATVDPDQLYSMLLQYAERLKRFRLRDAGGVVYAALEKGEDVLFEGAQGVLLDLVHGTYPFVTSSSTSAGGVCTGVGLGLSRIDKVVGVVKAYTTRLGKGPFPTELDDFAGRHIQKNGIEVGAYNGQKRRCGWLDLVALKYAMRVSGFTSFCFMKADVLSGFDTIHVAVGYELHGKKIDHFPSCEEMFQLKPVYKQLKGWKKNIRGANAKSKLPAELLKYIDFLEEALQIPCDLISTGPDPADTIYINEIFQKKKAALFEARY